MEAEEKGSGYIPSKLNLSWFPPTVIFKSHLLPCTVHILKMFIYFVLHLLARLINKPRKFKATLLFISGRTMEVFLHVKVNIAHLVTDIASHANAMNFGFTGDFASTKSTKPNPKSLKITNKTSTPKNIHDKLQLYFIRYKQNPNTIFLWVCKQPIP